MHFYLHFLTLILQCHLEKRHRVIICHFLNINFHNAAEKERKCCILISLAPYFPPSGGIPVCRGLHRQAKGGLFSVIPHPPVIPSPCQARGDITFPCHSVLDTESGVWIPACAGMTLSPCHSVLDTESIFF